jgi:hypothetical protein
MRPDTNIASVGGLAGLATRANTFIDSLSLMEVLLEERVDAAIKVKSVLVFVEAMGLLGIHDPFIGLAILVQSGAELLAVLNRNATITAAVSQQDRGLEFLSIE